MARAFHFQTAEIGSSSSRKDRSIAFRVITGEIPPEHMAQFFPLNGCNVSLLVTPHEQDEGDEPIEVDSEVDKKSQSERLRAVLFCIWDKKGRKGKFSDFYYQKTDDIIEWLKTKLD
jgi:hypothetical protein